MPNLQPDSLAEIRAAIGASFSDADYVYYVLKASPVAADFLGALVRLLRPELEQIDH